MFEDFLKDAEQQFRIYVNDLIDGRFVAYSVILGIVLFFIIILFITLNSFRKDEIKELNKSNEELKNELTLIKREIDFRDRIELRYKNKTD